MDIYHGYDFSDWIHPRACKKCGFITCKCRVVGIDRVSICQDDEEDWYVEFYLDDVRHGYMLKEVAEAMGESLTEQVA